MATWDDVRRLALAMPGADERTRGDGQQQWRVGDKLFVWQRPLRAADRAALGDAAPTGPILGARVPDVAAKEALAAEGGDVYFTTPHFDGYPAILVQLDNIRLEELEELIVEAWLARAPTKLVTAYLADHP